MYFVGGVKSVGGSPTEGFLGLLDSEKVFGFRMGGSALHGGGGPISRIGYGKKSSLLASRFEGIRKKVKTLRGGEG